LGTILIGLAFAFLSWGAAGASNAGAAIYTVNGLGDQADGNLGSAGCKTSLGSCTLRAAIEESNASQGIDDSIRFSDEFDGEAGDTIQLGTPLPSIVDHARLEGSPSVVQCETDFGAVMGPCVGIEGLSGSAVFQVEAERVVIKGFAITGAQTAIRAIGAPGLEVWNDWLGVKLNGGDGTNGTGIFVDPQSNGAFIGGSSSIARNIISNSAGAGLYIDGADNAIVRGNGFGISPLGSGRAENGTGIKITDSSAGLGSTASGNYVGATIGLEGRETSECDGGCNVISGAATSGIDLSGDGTEPPASGPTWITGNYIGLNAFGTGGIPNLAQGVLVGSAANVTIGGPGAGDPNNINGGAFGVSAGPGAVNLGIERNQIGTDPPGSKALAPPSSIGLAVDSGATPSNFAEIIGNRISMSGGTGIQQEGQGAVIESNVLGQGLDGEALPGGLIGLRLVGGGEQGNLIFGNTILRAAKYGLLVENDRNAIFGNRIEGSGGAGVRIEAPPGLSPSANWIGDPAEFRENTISNNAGNAIEVIGPASSENVIDRNTGRGNGGLFVDLGGDGPGNSSNGPSDGVQPPVIGGLSSSAVSGLARPGASVLIYSKTTPSEGELSVFLGRTSVDDGGAWSFSLKTPLPLGSSIAAMQTYAGVNSENEVVMGSSELAIATLLASQGAGDDGGGDPVVDPVCGLLGGRLCRPDHVPPQTIIRKQPDKTISAKVASFRFSSSEAGSRFECKFDGRASARCRSPRRYHGLDPGRHLFKVWAIDAAGNKDRHPAVWAFRVLGS
jgi:CSLREA domain-containing protein